MRSSASLGSGGSGGPGGPGGPGRVGSVVEALSTTSPVTFAEADEALGVLLDAVVAADRELAVVAARRAELIDRVRLWSRDSVDALARARGLERGSAGDHVIAARSTTAELACALRLPEGSVTALLVESEALVHDLPATMGALRDGAVSYRHAQVVMSATAALDEGPVRELDVMLAERAKTTTVANLGRVARRARERHDTRPLVERHTVAMVERHVELEPGRDGMAWLHQLLPAVQATAIYHRLSDIALACQGPGEERTLAQLRADACVELLLDDDAREAAATGSVWTGPPTPDSEAASSDLVDAPTSPLRVSMRGIRPVVAVTVPVMTLLGHSEEPGDLTGYGPIDASTGRELAAHAPTFIRLLTHPETGTTLSVGRDKYTVPADLRTWLQIRDQTCRFPGCSRRAARCDIDHITDWADQGTTTHTNLIHLCRKHHRLKHTTRWTPHLQTTQPGNVGAMVDDSLVHWVAPSGRSSTDHSAIAPVLPISRGSGLGRVTPPGPTSDESSRQDEDPHRSMADGPPPF